MIGKRSMPGLGETTGDAFEVNVHQSLVGNYWIHCQKNSDFWGYMDSMNMTDVGMTSSATF